ncbi:hypothetical protein [Chryseobacterium koreense]|uniref:hypothetical protein n=1 Tax=Chryseobacterium koreense TaxID=232216 RepID=UPI0026F063DC|nr:hypothetical protein [Chryseobacterium koreense]
MGTKNQISIEIPREVLTDVNEKLQECKTLLAPYLQAMTLHEKQSIFKMGDKTVATVQKVKSYMDTNPEFIPAYMDTAEFLKDEAVVTALDPLGNLATQLAADIKDTMMLAGSEAIVGALLYYGTTKEAAAKGIVTAQPIYEDLSKRFSRKTGKREPF